MPIASVDRVEGEVSFQPENGQRARLTKGQILEAGTAISTGAGGMTFVRFGQAGIMQLQPESRLKISTIDAEQGGRRIILHLNTGTVSILAQRMTSLTPVIEVHAPDGAIIAHSSIYTVSVENGKGFLLVSEGGAQVADPTTESATETPSKPISAESEKKPIDLKKFDPGAEEPKKKSLRERLGLKKKKSD